MTCKYYCSSSLSKKNPNTLRNFVPVNIIAGLAMTLVIFLGGIRLDEQNEVRLNVYLSPTFITPQMPLSLS